MSNIQTTTRKTRKILVTVPYNQYIDITPEILSLLLNRPVYEVSYPNNRCKYKLIDENIGESIGVKLISDNDILIEEESL